MTEPAPAADVAHGVAYQCRLADAARRACSSYLDAIGMPDSARRFAEYDQLTDGGQKVWREIVQRAVFDMLPVLRQAGDDR